jgi:hypothetical protein
LPSSFFAPLHYNAAKQALQRSVAFFAMLRCSTAPQEQTNKRCLWSCAATLRILCNVAPQTNKQTK